MCMCTIVSRYAFLNQYRYVLYLYTAHVCTCVCVFCEQLTKAFIAKTSCNQLLIDSATYLLAMNLLTLKSVAMNLYDIMCVLAY